MSVPLTKLELNFHKKEIYFPSTTDYKLITDDKYVIYYNVGQFVYEDTNYDSVTYKICYAYNGAIGFGYQFFPQLKSLGFHTIDREYVRILYCVTTQEPKYAYFSAHRNEGKWVEWDKCEKTENGELVVYVARASHANYPHCGTWGRIFFMANDKCCSNTNGIKLIPELVEEEFHTNIESSGSGSAAELKQRLTITK